MTIVPPGAVTPAGGDHFKVFTPYHRAWSELPLRRAAAGRRASSRVPSRARAPGGCRRSEKLTDGAPSPRRAQGGEREGRRLMRAFLRDGLGAVRRAPRRPRRATRTSRLSAHLRFGCVSPLELMREARERQGGAPFVRQLCWRDFHHQVLAAIPSLPRRDYRPRGDRWSRSRAGAGGLAARGRTGYPLVDAAMRQLAAEGFMHNRARMTVASFLTKDLYVDWRAGAWHFWDLLSDGEIANNAGNWQWVAGTGNDTRPNRVLNPRAPGRALRPRRRLRAPLPARAGVGRRQGDPPPLAAAKASRKLDYPRADRRPRRGGGGVQGPPRSYGVRHDAHRIGAMGRLAVILGSNALGPGGEEIARRRPSTGRRSCSATAAARAPTSSPTQIDHAANLRPLARAGLRPGAGDRLGRLAAAPSCRSAACSAPTTSSPSTSAYSIFADARAHSAPGFDPRWRGEVIAAWSAGGQAPRDGGVYWQTRGPRFETPAEIRLIAAHADVVGMTIASECIVAGELGLDYAALCVVDNLANGIGEGELDVAGDRGRPPRQRRAPARRPGGGAAAAGCGAVA